MRKTRESPNKGGESVWKQTTFKRLYRPGSRDLASDLCPGLLVLFEGVDLHPSFKGRDTIDGMAVIDEFLNHVGESRFRHAAGFVESLRLIGLLRVTVDLLEGLNPAFREHGQADELSMGLFMRHVLTDLDDAILFIRSNVPKQITLTRRILQLHKIGPDMWCRGSVLQLIVPGEINHEVDIGRTLQEFFQDGCLKNDVSVQHETSALHFILSTEE
jgi:hypothetical protein